MKRRRLLISALVLTACVAVGVAMRGGGASAQILAGDAPPPASAGFTVIPSPAISHGFLSAISAVSSSSIWAAGGIGPPSGGVEPLVEHYSGGIWKRVTPPDALAKNKQFEVVHAFSDSDVWLVGTGVAGFGEVVLHYDGTSWKKMTLPTYTGTRPSLIGLDGDAPDDVWVLGDTTAGLFVDRWNGTKWSSVPLPSGLTPSSDLAVGRSIRVLSPTDVWITGGNSPRKGGNLQASFVVHYNGTSWTQTMLSDPFGGGYTTIADINGTSDSNMWTVGDGGNYVVEQMLVYSAPNWAPMTPLPSIHQAHPKRTVELLGVLPLSTTNVWAVGYWQKTFYSDVSSPIIIHLAGGTWHQVAAENPGTGGLWSGLSAITSVPGAKTLWAVGAGPDGPLVERSG